MSSSPVSLFVIIFGVAAAVINVLQAFRRRIRHVAVPPGKSNTAFISHFWENRVSREKRNEWQATAGVESAAWENDKSTRPDAPDSACPTMLKHSLLGKRVAYIFRRINIIQHRRQLVRKTNGRYMTLTQLTVAAASGKASWQIRRSPG